MGEFGDMGANTFAVLRKQLAPLGFGVRATCSKVGVAEHFPNRHSRRFQAVEKLDPPQDGRGIIPLAGVVTVGKGQQPDAFVIPKCVRRKPRAFCQFTDFHKHPVVQTPRRLGLRAYSKSSGMLTSAIGIGRPPCRRAELGWINPSSFKAQTMPHTEQLTIAVLLGSVRTERQGIKAARLLLAALEARGHEAVLVDPKETRLPLLDRMYKEYPKGSAPADLEHLATLYRRADGFLLVSAEYNHGVPPALKNLLDHFLEEYFWRPSAIACYSAGGYGGVRAAMQLRAIVGELGMPSIPSLFAIPRIGTALGDDGQPTEPRITSQMNRFLDEFEWYMQALRRQRAGGTPY